MIETGIARATQPPVRIGLVNSVHNRLRTQTMPYTSTSPTIHL